MKRIPVLPTLIVLLAVAYMIHLGFWQLERLTQKEAMLARYEAAERLPDVVEIGAGPSIQEIEALGFRRVRWVCPSVGNDQMVGGRNNRGEVGWIHVVICTHTGFDYGADAALVLGWTRDPVAVRWPRGQDFTGVLVPGLKSGVALPNLEPGEYGVLEHLPMHIVADPPLAGLQSNAKPDPKDIPNNHLAYAVQWFLFAGVALVIYALALRGRMRGG